MAVSTNTARDVVISGFVGLVIGVVITLIVAAIIPTPWSLGQVLLAVGAASFGAAAGSGYGAARRR